MTDANEARFRSARLAVGIASGVVLATFLMPWLDFGAAKQTGLDLFTLAMRGRDASRDGPRFVRDLGSVADVIALVVGLPLACHVASLVMLAGARSKAVRWLHMFVVLIPLLLWVGILVLGTLIVSERRSSDLGRLFVQGATQLLGAGVLVCLAAQLATWIASIVLLRANAAPAGAAGVLPNAGVSAVSPPPPGSAFGSTSPLAAGSVDPYGATAFQGSVGGAGAQLSPAQTASVTSPPVSRASRTPLIGAVAAGVALVGGVVAFVALRGGAPTPESLCRRLESVSGPPVGITPRTEQCIAEMRDLQRNHPSEYQQASACITNGQAAGDVAQCLMHVSLARERARLSTAAYVPPPAPPAPIAPPSVSPPPAPTPMPVAPPAAPSPSAIETVVPASVRASSFIDGRDAHPAEHAFDGNPRTAWNESAPGSGTGEWLEAQFAAPRHVRRITLTPGWDFVSPRWGDLFVQNSHVRRLRVVYSDGTSETRDVGDGQRSVTLDVDHVTTSLRFVADDVYPGTRWQDLCVSEVVIEADPAAQ